MEESIKFTARSAAIKKGKLKLDEWCLPLKVGII
jgi:hypothetical protein